MKLKSDPQKVTVPWQVTVTFIFFFFFIQASILVAQNHQNNWQWKNRLQFGLDYDSNVKETRVDQKKDGLSKLIWDSQAKYFSQNYFVNMQYHGGIQGYFCTPEEHKMAHDLSGTFVYQLLPKVRLGTRLWGRFKYFNRYDWHYVIRSSELFFTFNILKSHLTAAYENEGLNYLNYNRFNFNTNHLYLALVKRLARYLSGQLKSGYRSINYQRYALFYDPQSNEIRSRNYKQQDNHYYVSVQASVQKKFLSNLEYQFSRNSSNSYGFSYREHRVTLSIVCPFSEILLLRIYGGLQRKKYDEALSKIIVTEFDTEREISNFFITDFSTDLTDKLSLLFRYSWYNNESPVPGRYYQKTLLSCSIEYRF